MKSSLRTVFAAVLLSSTTNAAVCIGKNCELLDSISSSKGVPLQTVLNNIQNDIIDPIVDSQSMMASWQGGMLDYSPDGTNGDIKVTVWGGISLDTINVRGNFFGTKYGINYDTGIVKSGIGVEMPLSETIDLVLNGTFWKGPADYGTGYVDASSDELNIRLGAGVKKTVLWNAWTSFYYTAGVIASKRNFVILFPGIDVNIRTPLGIVGWKGEETYDESTSFLSFPTTFGGKIKLWKVTIIGETGARLIGQTGTLKVQKWGAVGPFFGEAGYYNIGFFNQKSVDSIGVWPIARLGFEVKTFYDLSLMGSWQPKLERQPQHVNFGIGLQFLKKLNSSKS